MGDERERRKPTPTDDRTGEYGGDDGALEHERTEVQPGEDTGIEATPAEEETRDVQPDPNRRRR